MTESVTVEPRKIENEFPLLKQIGKRASKLAIKIRKDAIEVAEHLEETQIDLLPGAFDHMTKKQFDTIVEATVVLLAWEMYSTWVVQEVKGVDMKKEGVELEIKRVNLFLLDTILAYLEEKRGAA